MEDGYGEIDSEILKMENRTGPRTVSRVELSFSGRLCLKKVKRHGKLN
jgi:hypothetical protein